MKSPKVSFEEKIMEIIDNYPAIQSPVEEKGLMFRLRRSWLRGVSREIAKEFQAVRKDTLEAVERGLPKEKTINKKKHGTDGSRYPYGFNVCRSEVLSLISSMKGGKE